MPIEKVQPGMLKSLNYALNLLIAAEKRCTNQEDKEKIIKHVMNLTKLRNVCLFALSDLRFDFSGVLKEQEKRLLKDIDHGST